MNYKEFENKLICVLINLLNCDIDIQLNNNDTLTISCYNMPMFRSFDIYVEIDTNKFNCSSFSEVDVLKIIKAIVNNLL